MESIEKVTGFVTAVAQFSFCMVAGILVSTFGEYAMHRYMHWSTCPLGQLHRRHHAIEPHWPFFREYFGYALTHVIGFYFIYLIWPEQYVQSLFVPIATWAAVTMVFSAYAHTLQHENAVKCTWMKMPVHYAHHKGRMWKHNYGICVDWWDKLFGTYKEYDWLTPDMIKKAEASYWDISWTFLKEGRGRID